MEQLIPIVNKLQDVFNTLGQDNIDLPQIVVVGSQSSGKSSVLENIVTRDFLPRGTDIVTRCPLVLQLIHFTSFKKNFKSEKGGGNVGVSSSIHHHLQYHGNYSSHFVKGDDQNITDLIDDEENPLEEWGEFSHIPNKKFTDFSLIRKEIEKQTQSLAGNNKNISKQPIFLKIVSPNVLNLTLVDLPGITKIPVGDQPPDIEQQIKNLLYEYCVKPNSLILAVTPANMDLVNSEALKFAREADPTGSRTIGVLTKLDLMDAGTHALDILSNHSSYKLKLGFIGVICRSQKDIMEGKPISDALKDEEAYFRHHPYYRSVAHRCGSVHLSKTLNQILMNHIKDKLPDLKNRMNQLIQNTQNELQAYGETVFHGKSHRGTLLLKIITKFSTDFSEYIDGTSKHISTTELNGGARLNFIFHDHFHNSLMSNDACQGLGLTDIRTAIKNATGTRPSLFVPEISFELLVKQQIAKLLLPSLKCVEMVFEELLKLLQNCETAELHRYPLLEKKLMEAAADFIREKLEPTKNMVDNLILIELAYINTNHPDFIRAGTAISALCKIYERRKKDIIQLNLSKDRHTSSSKEDSHLMAKNEFPINDEGKIPVVAPPPGAIANSVSSRPLASANNTITGVTNALGPNSMNTSHRPTITSPNNHGGSAGGLLHYFFRGSYTSPMIQTSPTSNPHSRLPGAEKGKTSVIESIDGVILEKGAKETPFNFQVRDRIRKADIVENDTIGPTDLNANMLANLSLDDPSSPSSELTEKEEMETHLILSLIQSYYNVVRKNILDLVPKSIMCFLVNSTKEGMQNRLVSELYKEDQFGDLLKEDEGIQKERMKCQALLEAYNRALLIIHELKEVNFLLNSNMPSYSTSPGIPSIIL